MSSSGSNTSIDPSRLSTAGRIIKACLDAGAPVSASDIYRNQIFDTPHTVYNGLAQLMRHTNGPAPLLRHGKSGAFTYTANPKRAEYDNFGYWLSEGLKDSDEAPGVLATRSASVSQTGPEVCKCGRAKTRYSKICVVCYEEGNKTKSMNYSKAIEKEKKVAASGNVTDIEDVDPIILGIVGKLPAGGDWSADQRASWQRMLDSALDFIYPSSTGEKE